MQTLNVTTMIKPVNNIRRQIVVVLLFALVSLPLVVLAESVHPDVQAALDWQMPENECEFKIRRTNVGGREDRLYKKAMKKYEKCIASYLAGLAAEREKMMAVAHHGLTQAQADTILTHMGVIKIVMQRSKLKSVVPDAIRELDYQAGMDLE